MLCFGSTARVLVVCLVLSWKLIVHGASHSTNDPTVEVTSMKSASSQENMGISNLTEPKSTSNPMFETTRDDIRTLPCSSVKEQYSLFTFRYKYSVEEVTSALCRCMNICKKGKLPKSIKDSAQDFLYNPTSDFNKIKFIIVLIIFGMMFLIGCTGNVMVLFGLAKWMKNMSPTFAFIMNLCICDLLMLWVSMPLKVVEYFHLSSVFTMATCKISYYIRDFILVCTVLTHTVISFERFYAICRPMEVQYLCTWSRAKKIIAATWVLSLGLAVPSIFMMKFFKYGTQTLECMAMSDSEMHVLLYFIYYFGILFVVPSVIMCITYGRSCHMLWRSTLVTEKLQGNNGKHSHHKESESVQSRRKVIKLLIAVVVLFIVCWGPLFLVMILDFHRRLGGRRYELRLMAAGLCYLSSTINPYLFMSMSSIERLIKILNYRQFERLKICCKSRYKVHRDISYNNKGVDGSGKTATTSGSGGEELQSVTCEDWDMKHGARKDSFDML